MYDSVHGGGGLCMVGVCMVKGHAWHVACEVGGMHGEGCVAGWHEWWEGGCEVKACMSGACMVGGMCGGRGVHGRGHAWSPCRNFSNFFLK